MTEKLQNGAISTLGLTVLIIRSKTYSNKEKGRRKPRMPIAFPALSNCKPRTSEEMICMSMLMPTRRNRGLLSDFMFDPFDAFFNTPMPSAQTPTLMRTDIKETDGGFEMTIDLPGFKKDDVNAELKDGYLHIEAQTKSETEDKDASGTYVRKERFSGKCSRTFYVGEDVEEKDIKAKFEDGTLKIDIPKKQEQPKLEEKKTIAIEG